MDRSLSPITSKLERLLTGTRVFKRHIKKANEIHSTLGSRLRKLSSPSDSSKCAEFKGAFETYISFTNSFIKYNESIIKDTDIAYKTLKFATADLKSRIKLIKNYKKTLKKNNDKKNEGVVNSIVERCNKEMYEGKQANKKYVDEATNLHLSALKGMRNSGEVQSVDGSAEEAKSRKKHSAANSIAGQPKKPENLEKSNIKVEEKRKNLAKPAVKLQKKPENGQERLENLEKPSFESSFNASKPKESSILFDRHSALKSRD